MGTPSVKEWLNETVRKQQSEGAIQPRVGDLVKILVPKSVPGAVPDRAGNFADWECVKSDEDCPVHSGTKLWSYEEQVAVVCDEWTEDLLEEVRQMEEANGPISVPSLPVLTNTFGKLCVPMAYRWNEEGYEAGNPYKGRRYDGIPIVAVKLLSRASEEEAS